MEVDNKSFKIIDKSKYSDNSLNTSNDHYFVVNLFAQNFLSSNRRVVISKNITLVCCFESCLTIITITSLTLPTLKLFYCNAVIVEATKLMLVNLLNSDLNIRINDS